MNKEGEPIKVTLPDGREMVFQAIPAGEFRMGQRGEYANEEPVTMVKVGPFWMGQTQVTQAQYRVMAKKCADQLTQIEGNKGAEPCHFKGDERPVETVNWYEARAVAEWLTEYLESEGLLPEGYVVDLPWEVQWEYACRAGSETEYHTGDGEAALKKAGWYDGNSKSETHDVGGLEANRWGLHDMHGNVWEWCRDQFDDATYRLRVPGVSENESPEGEGSRVIRGGSWGNGARYCRSAYRYRYRPGYRCWDFGFRLALVPGPGEPVRQEAGGPGKGAEPKAAAVEARDETEQAQAAGGASSAKSPADKADLNTNFPPRSGGEIF